PGVYANGQSVIPMPWTNVKTITRQPGAIYNTKKKPTQGSCIDTMESCYQNVKNCHFNFIRKRCMKSCGLCGRSSWMDKKCSEPCGVINNNLKFKAISSQNGLIGQKFANFKHSKRKIRSYNKIV
ncbi:unnamed protein product, partial [Meganyctiphanes norvegica]